ncbi:hypothetical protein [Herbaspirillum aquaticum]|uniref:Uncharacterized protein n=1 Tax=Herbaspirillum aquaticum TaxID=568783 RepID=A0A225SP22_9BURK|nr:hypothetical protein [Herbaspirillum aquaticum]OWY32219.1 hypothetical protein CEJ45_22195 [Herbaspirillum aquaticum]
MKNIKIISDGTAEGTHVFDSDGKKIDGIITSISWGIDADGRIGEATITFSQPVVELEGEISDG